MEMHTPQSLKAIHGIDLTRPQRPVVRPILQLCRAAIGGYLRKRRVLSRR